MYHNISSSIRDMVDATVWLAKEEKCARSVNVVIFTSLTLKTEQNVLINTFNPITTHLIKYFNLMEYIN